jgi:hypothetical protein
MAGEPLPECEVGERGLLGDRGYCLSDPAKNKVASAKHAEFPGLMRFRARYVAAGRLEVTLPDGRRLPVHGPGPCLPISEWFGRPIAVSSLSEPAERRPAPGRHAMTGTFFDYAPLHLITEASMASFAAVAAGSVVAVDRFRPNLVLASPDSAGYPENHWVGRTLRVGTDVLIEVTDPCPRCVMITLEQKDLPADAGLLKVLAQENMQEVPVLTGRHPSLGAYAFVKRGGKVHVGDSVDFA